LGLALTDGQIEALLGFSRLLLRWNQVHNLTAIRAGDDFLTHHLLDSLALVAPMNAALARRDLQSGRVLDVGAGGGLPGIPLAIACPHLQVTLIDAVQKKAAFLTQVALELRLSNVTVHQGRVEQYLGQFDVITSRAFAALADFVAWTRHLLGPGASWLAMKARINADELRALPADVQVVATLPLTVPGLNEQRHVLEIRPT
jgi:16S rRNA (guanine527-N7)-methyltransferase